MFKLCTDERFCQQVRKHVFGGQVLQLDLARVDPILDEEVSDVDMLRPLGGSSTTLGEGHGSEVVLEEDGGAHVITLLDEEVPRPDEH